MSDQIKNAQIEWRDGVIPIAHAFDDPYFSINDGLSETQFVFLDGNGLPDRFRDGFHVAELGFGTGLNLLATWQAWIDAGFETPLRFTSFEAFPMTISDMRQALANWPVLNDLADVMFAQLENGWAIQTDTLDARIVIGDARHRLPAWDGRVDAWFLDGFSPAKNPELWDADLMDAVCECTVSGGTFATYSSAGFVRARLADAGFEVNRKDGYGRKRHMSVGVKP
jgi:tRNA U34 5-methylaminomethyl-2-thiouridine-forming methyltransferase MnmC